jgi:protein TonB
MTTRSQSHRQNGLCGLGTSVVIHACLISILFLLFVHGPTFSVRSGRTSTMTLALVTAPVPVPKPPVPLPMPVPQPVVQVPLVPVPLAQPVLKPVIAPPVHAAIVAQVHHPANKPTTVASEAPHGAIVPAMPDDLHNPQPDYPEESRLNHEEGFVMLQVNVTAGGEPAHVSVLQSSGYFRLDRAAVESIQQWRFHPATAAGMPIPAETEVPIRFQLTNPPTHD